MKTFDEHCSTFEIGAVQTCENLVHLENAEAYLGAKIGFDTEENEPSKVCSFG